MNFLWVIGIALLVVFVLKMILKTLKIAFVFAILAILVIVYFLWQNGIILPFK